MRVFHHVCHFPRHLAAPARAHVTKFCRELLISPAWFFCEGRDRDTGAVSDASKYDAPARLTCDYPSPQRFYSLRADGVGCAAQGRWGWPQYGYELNGTVTQCKSTR